jgi:hypothetical protein
MLSQHLYRDTISLCYCTFRTVNWTSFNQTTRKVDIMPKYSITKWGVEVRIKALDVPKLDGGVWSTRSLLPVG